MRGCITLHDEGLSFEERLPFRVRADSWETLVFPLPAGSPPTLLVRIEVDNPFSPRSVDPPSTDDRLLGIAVRAMSLR